MFKILLLTTWGDPYYVGLNGLELYDHNFKLIPIREEESMCALVAVAVAVDVVECCCASATHMYGLVACVRCLRHPTLYYSAARTASGHSHAGQAV
jgi:hypothetical protein